MRDTTYLYWKRRPSSEEAFLLFCCCPGERPLPDALRRELGGPLSAGRLARRLEAYPFHGGRAPVWNVLDQRPDLLSCLPPRLVEVLRKEQPEIVRKSRARIAAILTLVEELRAFDVDVIVLKGPALMLSGCCEIGARRFNDVDFLIRREDLERAETCLRSLGSWSLPEQEKHRQWYLDSHHHPPPLFYPIHDSLRLCVELQWSVSGLPIADALADGIWRRARGMVHEGCPVRVPALEDLFVHSMVDLVSHRFMNGIKSLCDLERIARASQPEVDWRIVAERLEELRLTKEALLIVSLLDRLGMGALAELRGRLAATSLAPSLVDAAEEVLLRDVSERMRSWQWIAGLLCGAPVADRMRRPGKLAEVRRRHSRLHRWTRHLYRAVCSLPDAANILRREAAELIVLDWIDGRHVSHSS